MDHEEFGNFRPISNLKSISKAIEKTVASQVNNHFDYGNLNEIFQSEYKEKHSTETALVRINSNILLALDYQQLVILLLLGLLVAFDTVDHRILLNRLSSRFGLRNGVLEWFRSYLSNRKQFVSVNGCVSSQQDLPFGVLQSSILGPILFLLYTAPLADILRNHGMDFHLYANDTQIYISFKSSEVDLATANVEECIRDVDNWMSHNMFKLNRGKTELLILNSRHRPSPFVVSVVSVSPSVVFCFFTICCFVHVYGTLIQCHLQINVLPLTKFKSNTEIYLVTVC